MISGIWGGFLCGLSSGLSVCHVGHTVQPLDSMLIIEGCSSFRLPGLCTLPSGTEVCAPDSHLWQQRDEKKGAHYPTPSGHYSHDWSEYVNVIGVISEPFARESTERIVKIRMIL